MDEKQLENRLTALEESEMQMFRFLADRPAGVILTAETDIMLARLLAAEKLAELTPDDRAFIPEDILEMYRSLWSDELILRWRKQNWMYKCLSACKDLYGVMTWEILKKLFALRYPGAEMDEIRDLYGATPSSMQWFTARGGRLVLNGFEKDGYYEYLERQIQRDVPYYIPSKEEVEELYDQGSLISLESHSRLRDFIAETYHCGENIAVLKVHQMYDAVNDRVRMNDAADAFAGGNEGGIDFAFQSDEIQMKFIELYIEMSRECRIRDNRGHDYYEMVAMMADRNRRDSGRQQMKRVKVGRNDPCPCGSGKKYKNCCGRN